MVKVAMATVELDDIEAVALAFSASGGVPGDMRRVAALAREELRSVAAAAVAQRINAALDDYRADVRERELAAARAEAAAAAAKVKALESQAADAASV